MANSEAFDPAVQEIFNSALEADWDAAKVVRDRWDSLTDDMRRKLLRDYPAELSEYLVLPHDDIRTAGQTVFDQYFAEYQSDWDGITPQLLKQSRLDPMQMIFSGKDVIYMTGLGTRLLRAKPQEIYLHIDDRAEPPFLTGVEAVQMLRRAGSGETAAIVSINYSYYDEPVPDDMANRRQAGKRVIIHTMVGYQPAHLHVSGDESYQEDLRQITQKLAKESQNRGYGKITFEPGTPSVLTPDSARGPVAQPEPRDSPSRRPIGPPTPGTGFPNPFRHEPPRRPPDPAK